MGAGLVNEIGNRYGKWIVISRSPNGKSREARWLCRCDCGNTSSIYGTNLRKGLSTSCGCNQEKDITGKRFGKLVAIKRDSPDRRKWVCKCDCGNKVSVAGVSLRNESTKSCGCISQIIDMNGKVFGGLTVLYRVDNKVKIDERGKICGGVAMWMCLCSCGNKKAISGGSLRSGKTKSCGCKRTLEYGKSSFNLIYASNKKGAKKRGISWEITPEIFREITSKNCFYCGKEPSTISYNKTLNGTFIYNGIDRVDNSMGYVVGNIVSCCYECNKAKSTMSVVDFKNMVTRIYNHWILRQDSLNY